MKHAQNNRAHFIRLKARVFVCEVFESFAYHGVFDCRMEKTTHINFHGNYFYLHLVDVYGFHVAKWCKIYHTWILWGLKQNKMRSLIVHQTKPITSKTSLKMNLRDKAFQTYHDIPTKPLSFLPIPPFCGPFLTSEMTYRSHNSTYFGLKKHEGSQVTFGHTSHKWG